MSAGDAPMPVLSALHRARASPKPRRYSGIFHWRQRHFRSARMANHFLCPVRTTRAHAYEISWTSSLNPLARTDLTTSSMWTALLDQLASLSLRDAGSIPCRAWARIGSGTCIASQKSHAQSGSVTLAARCCRRMEPIRRNASFYRMGMTPESAMTNGDAWNMSCYHRAIRTRLGEALRAHFDHERTPLPHQLLTLLMQLNEPENAETQDDTGECRNAK